MKYLLLYLAMFCSCFAGIHISRRATDQYFPNVIQWGDSVTGKNLTTTGDLTADNFYGGSFSGNDFTAERGNSTLLLGSTETYQILKSAGATVQAFHLFTDNNTEQLVLNTDGSISSGGSTNKLDISSAGDLSFSGTAGIVLPHLMQSDSTDQAIASATAEQVITFNTDVHHNLITRTSSSRFTITKAGSYLLTFSAIGICADAVPGKYFVIWMKLNGNNVADSSTYYTFKSQNFNAVVTVTFLYHFAANDYFEFWMYGNDTDVKLDATAAVAANPGVIPAIPACPSIIMTCQYVGKD